MTLFDLGQGVPAAARYPYRCCGRGQAASPQSVPHPRSWRRRATRAAGTDRRPGLLARRAGGPSPPIGNLRWVATGSAPGGTATCVPRQRSTKRGRKPSVRCGRWPRTARPIAGMTGVTSRSCSWPHSKACDGAKRPRCGAQTWTSRRARCMFGPRSSSGQPARSCSARPSPGPDAWSSASLWRSSRY